MDALDRAVGIGEQLEALGLKLPLSPSRDPAETGVIRDARGRGLITIDVDNNLSDRTADAIAKLVAEAVNVAGGYAVEDRGRDCGPRVVARPVGAAGGYAAEQRREADNG